jgi:hypothetical protein
MPRNPDKTDYSQGFPAGLRSFERIKDPRRGGNTLHHFGEIIFVAFTCILCGVKSTTPSSAPPTTANASAPAVSGKNNFAPPKTKPTSNNASP